MTVKLAPGTAQQMRSDELIVFEEHAKVGAAWEGSFGYTDGTPEVCTAPRFDLTKNASQVLPGSMSPSFRSAFHAYMTRCYTWRPLAPTTHKDLAKYLADSEAKASAALAGQAEVRTSAKVEHLEPLARGRWRIHIRDGEACEVDALVVTGPGPTRVQIPEASGATNVVAAEDYWRHSSLAGSIAVFPTERNAARVVIAGAGGAAAAIALDLCRRYYRTPSVPRAADLDDDGAGLSIVFVAPQASLFTRGQSRWETDVLTDDAAWTKLSRALRAQVGEHLLAGVVFSKVLDEPTVEGQAAP